MSHLLSAAPFKLAQLLQLENSSQMRREGAIGEQEAVGSIRLWLNGQHGSRVTQVRTLLKCTHC